MVYHNCVDKVGHHILYIYHFVSFKNCLVPAITTKSGLSLVQSMGMYVHTVSLKSSLRNIMQPRCVVSSG